MPRVRGRPGCRRAVGLVLELENRTTTGVGADCGWAAVVRGAASPEGVKAASKHRPRACTRRCPGNVPLTRSMASTASTARGVGVWLSKAGVWIFVVALPLTSPPTGSATNSPAASGQEPTRTRPAGHREARNLAEVRAGRRHDRGHPFGGDVSTTSPGAATVTATIATVTPAADTTTRREEEADRATRLHTWDDGAFGPQRAGAPPT